MGPLDPWPAISPNPSRRVSAAATPHDAAAAAAPSAAVAAAAPSPASHPSPVPLAGPSSPVFPAGEATPGGVALLDSLDRYAEAVREYYEPTMRERVRQAIPPAVLSAAIGEGADTNTSPAVDGAPAAAGDEDPAAAADGDAACSVPFLSDASRPPVPTFTAAAAPCDLATCPDARLTRALLTWFKDDFFTWIDTLPCGSCGGPTTVTDTVGPSDDERAGRASRVELHECSACGTVARFARFAYPLKLLSTRRGRCGEWAQAFTAVAVAAGLTARLIVDSTDHLWTEVWSHTARRWVHADACEAALDTPLLYEAGWGKRLAYILAAGEGVADVTRRYTGRYAELTARRTVVGEAWLAASLARRNATALAALPQGAVRDAAAARGVADWEALHGGGVGTGAPPIGAGGEGVRLPGRQSGAADWVRERGENGGG